MIFSSRQYSCFPVKVHNLLAWLNKYTKLSAQRKNCLTTPAASWGLIYIEYAAKDPLKSLTQRYKILTFEHQFQNIVTLQNTAQVAIFVSSMAALELFRVNNPAEFETCGVSKFDGNFMSRS